MITGRGADDAAGAFGFRQLGDAVMRAPDLEGEDRLHVLALEQHLGAQTGRQQLHLFERGFLGDLID
ncbi:hypothetical protein FQZ97_1209350 [compost metagenome]